MIKETKKSSYNIFSNLLLITPFWVFIVWIVIQEKVSSLHQGIFPNSLLSEYIKDFYLEVLFFYVPIVFPLFYSIKCQVSQFPGFMKEVLEHSYSSLVLLSVIYFLTIFTGCLLPGSYQILGCSAEPAPAPAMPVFFFFLNLITTLFSSVIISAVVFLIKKASKIIINL